MISSFMVLNLRGDVLVYRDYRGEVKRSEFNSFSLYLLSAKNLKNTPVIYHNGVSYFYISQKDLFIIASSKSNSNVALIFEFFYSFLHICKCYFGNELSDSVVRQNYVLIYELLDEILDYGVPQITEPEMLKHYIVEGGLDVSLQSDTQKLIQLTMQATGANSWRPKPITYKKNIIWIDVIEEVIVSFNSDGDALRSEALGKIQVKCQLSGMPECTFGLNDKLSLQRDMVEMRKTEQQRAVLFKDLKFHRCVKLNKFNKERAITFMPPDGEFTLMNYIISQNISIPFKIISFFSKNQDTIEMKIKLKANFDKYYTGQNIEMFIPVPKNIVKINNSAGIGKAKLDSINNVVVWRMKKIQGQKEALLRIYITVQKDWNSADWKKPPITMKFFIPMWTSSGVTNPVDTRHKK